MTVHISEEDARKIGVGGKRRHKYGAKPQHVDGIRFASKKEATRYGELLLMEKAGNICGLKLQPRYPLIVNGEKIGTYVGDFWYVAGDGEFCEDTKGVATAVFKLKIALARVLYPRVKFLVT